MLARATIHDYELSALTVYSIEQLNAPLNLPYDLSLSSIEDMRSLLHTKSRIIDLFMARRLHAHLPQTAKIDGFQLCFATYLHGWNLNTLYSLIEGRYPCLIILKSVEMEAVIGAYITTNISPPSNTTKGDGDCFIFRLDGPTGSCYHWALLNYHQPAMISIQPPPTPSTISSTSHSPSSPPQLSILHSSPNVITTNTDHIESNSIQEDKIEAPISLPEIISPPPSSSHVLQQQHQHHHYNHNNHHLNSNGMNGIHNSTTTSTSSSTHNQNNNSNIQIPLKRKSKSLQLIESNVHLGSATFHQFIHCTVDYMAIGGSSKHGTNAIRITSDLMLCSCGHSDTYNNSSLTPDEPNDPWYISDIEVFCGQHTKKR